MTSLPLHLKYTLPGAAAPSEDLLAITEDQLTRALVILRGQEPDQEQVAPVALYSAASDFVELLINLQTSLNETAQLGLDLVSPPEPGSPTRLATAKLADLRAIGSGPKQIAALLGCEAGFFDGPPDEIVCVFSPVRFAPTAGFFDMRQG